MRWVPDRKDTNFGVTTTKMKMTPPNDQRLKDQIHPSQQDCQKPENVEQFSQGVDVRLLDHKRNFTAGNMTVRRQHLPAQPIGTRFETLVPRAELSGEV